MREEDSEESCRRREDAAIRLEQKFNDFVEVYERDQENAKEWRRSFETKVKGIEDWVTGVKHPYKLMIWMLGVSMTAIFYETGRMIVVWMKTHWQ